MSPSAASDRSAVDDFLSANGLGELVDLFKREGLCNMEEVASLTEDELEAKLHMPFGKRKAFLKAVENFTLDQTTDFGFWDFENCPTWHPAAPGQGCVDRHAGEVAQHIINHFELPWRAVRAYFNPVKFKPPKFDQIQQALHTAGVVPVPCPSPKQEEVDRTIADDIQRLLNSHPRRPRNIVLITGDRDYSRCVDWLGSAGVVVKLVHLKNSCTWAFTGNYRLKNNVTWEELLSNYDARRSTPLAQRPVRRKTELCKYYMNGNTCAKGSNDCSYAHGEQELQPRQGHHGSSQPCLTTQHPPAARGNEGSFVQRPDRRKTELCKYYMNGNKCAKGSDECSYAHGEQELQPRQVHHGSSQPGQTTQHPPASRGNEGSFVQSPDRRKTELCKYYMNGNKCTKGFACSYAHGEQGLSPGQGYHGSSQPSQTTQHPPAHGTGTLELGCVRAPPPPSSPSPPGPRRYPLCILGPC